MRAVEHCTADQVRELFAEFGTIEESVRNGVQHLKEWIRKQPHLPNMDDDEWLTKFLLRRNNNLEDTKKKIESYFIMRTTMPEYFQGREQFLNEMRHIVQYGCFVPALKLNPDGSRVVMFRIFDNSKTTYNYNEMVKLAFMLLDLTFKMNHMRGMMVVYDFHNINMNMVAYLLSNLKKLLTLAKMKTYLRHYKIYVINAPPILNPAIDLFKKLATKKMVDRLEIWTDDPKNLISVLPKEVLPPIYGGNECSLEEMRDIWCSELEKYRDWFVSDECNRADLSKKPVDHSNNIFSDYGVDGSFRKVSFD